MAKTSGGHTLTPIDSRFVAQNIGIFQVQGSNFSFLSCSSLPFFFSSSSSDFNLDPNTVSIHHTLNLLKTCQNMAQLFQIQARLLTSALFQNPSFAGRILKLSTDFEDCKLECLKSCNCTGYASASINVGGRGCYAWYGELNDIRTYVDGQDFYIRVDALELDNYKRNNSNSTSGRKRMKAIIIILTVIPLVLLLFCCSLYARRKHVLRKDCLDFFLHLHKICLLSGISDEDGTAGKSAMFSTFI